MKNQEDELEIEGCGHQECGRFDPTWATCLVAGTVMDSSNVTVWVVPKTETDQIVELKAENARLKAKVEAARRLIVSFFNSDKTWLEGKQASDLLAILEGTPE